MKSTFSAFSTNETALDSNGACFCADKHQDAASPEFDLTQRRAAAQVDAKGKYEPCLSEHGIPSDVLAKLLPGDDIVELVEPKVGGGLGYRFIKRAFDLVSCGCALIVLAIPMVVIAAKIKLESPGPSSTRRSGLVRTARFSTYTNSEACIPTPRLAVHGGPLGMTPASLRSASSCGKNVSMRFLSFGTS